MATAGNNALAQARFLALAVPAGLLAGAYISQYGFGLFPCEMCWWQRYAHFAALPFGLLAYARKDLRYYTNMTENMPVASPIAEAIHQIYVLADTLGYGERFVPRLIDMMIKNMGGK